MKQIPIVLLIVATLAVAGCGGSHDQKHSPADMTPKSVSVARVERLATGAQDEIMGSVVARNTADISTKVQSRVDRILVDIGSRVHQGDLLAQLDTREFEAKVQQARAMHEQASGDLARFQKLLAQNAATQQEFDGVKARATVAEANLSEAETFLSYARIIAPFSGVVTRKMVDVGDLPFPGQPTFTLEESGAPRFVVTIAESSRRKITVGQSVAISIPVIDTTVAGRVEELSPSADPMSRTFTVKIGLPALDQLRPGQFGRLQLPAENESDEETLFIPRSAWVRRGQLDLVYVVTPENKAMLRLVRIGRQLPDKLEILSGLRENETVVVSDQRDLLDGDLVRGVS
jgi:RND family efflux transporter MFP subunit